MPLSLPSPHSVYSLASGVLSQAELSWILGAAALVPLSASAWGFGNVQGAVISQADVGAEGFPEPLAEERRLPCGRCFREQEGAVQRGKEPGQGASSCTHHTVRRFSRHSCWKTHGSLFPVVSNPSLTSPLRTGTVSSVPCCLTSLPCWPPWCPRMPRVHGCFPPCQPPLHTC